MNSITKLALAAVTAGLLSVSASLVMAQSGHEGHHPDGAPKAAEPAQPSPPAASPEMKPGQMMGGGMMSMMGGCQMMDAKALDGIKAKLSITSSQQPAWDAVAEALKKNAVSMQTMHQTMMKMMETKSPAGRLDAHIGAMESRIAAMKALKQALAGLDAVLNDEQKKTAEQMLTGTGCMM